MGEPHVLGFLEEGQNTEQNTKYFSISYSVNNNNWREYGEPFSGVTRD